MKIKVIKPKTETEMKRKRVCAYVRVSTDSLEQEGSLDNQSAYFADYIRSNPAWEFALAAEMIDNHQITTQYTGKSSRRCRR